MAQTPEEAEQLVHTWADAHNAQWMQVRHALYLHTKNPVHAWRRCGSDFHERHNSEHGDAPAC